MDNRLGQYVAAKLTTVVGKVRMDLLWCCKNLKLSHVGGWAVYCC